MSGPQQHRAWKLCLAVLVLCAPSFSQTLLRSSPGTGDINIINSDMAVLSAGQVRTDLPCRVTPLTPRLGFDLQFLAGYKVTVPLRELAGGGDQLRMLFRIQPLDGKGKYFYFLDRYTVPAIDEDVKGDAALAGYYTLGPGRYRVEWLMRNRAEQVCSANWEIETHSAEDFEDLAMTRAAYTVGPREPDLFAEDPPVMRSAKRRLLHVKLLVNFSPSDPGDIRLRKHDLRNLVSIIRAISREPNIGTFSVTAFNMQEERVLFQQTNVPRIDFPALGEAVESVEGGVVDAAQLADEESGTRFLTGLLQEHLGAQNDEPDAIILLGPKLLLDKKVSVKQLAEAGQVTAPVFYLIYDTTPTAYPWKDAISSVLKIYKALEYTITLPKDLGKAMNSMLPRLKPRAAVNGWQEGSGAATE